MFCINFDKKMGWATFWVIIFTNPSGHPDHQLHLNTKLKDADSVDSGKVKNLVDRLLLNMSRLWLVFVCFVTVGAKGLLGNCVTSRVTG
jgi:hypothetical protein